MQNVGKIVKSLATMQLNVAKIQKELAASEFTGSAAGGLVEVDTTGDGVVLRARMNPAVRDEDAETIAALFVVAMNNATSQKEELAKSKMPGISAGLLPAGFKIPGL
jgi:DNA-binding YbaB/EbfC family protein